MKTSLPTSNPANQNLDKTTTPLNDVVPEFLRTQSFPANQYRRDSAPDDLARLAAGVGNLPIGQITSAQIINIVFQPDVHFPESLLGMLNYFFGWCIDQGYLPVTHTSPVSTLQRWPRSPKWSILTPSQLQTLFIGFDNVEARIYVALGAFAGI